MRKVIAILIPVAIITLFILIMVSAPYLKQSFSDKDDVIAMIGETKKLVNSQNWVGAEESADQLEVAWDIITNRVQFGTEREELKDGKKSIARLKAYLEANDRAGSLAELAEVKEQWTSIGEWD